MTQVGLVGVFAAALLMGWALVQRSAVSGLTGMIGYVLATLVLVSPAAGFVSPKRLAVASRALVSPAVASPSSSAPLTELTQAQSELSGLIASADPSGQAALSDAVAQLGDATAQSLWSDSSDAIPPPPSDEVFTGAANALDDLAGIRHDPTVSGAALASAGDEIVDACDTLADAALRRAELPDDRSASGESAESVRDDQGRYDRAFKVLGAEITGEVASIPQRTINQAAETFLSSPNFFNAEPPAATSGSPLTLDGKPELFYYGAEYCPFCAATRWSMVLALAQFGEISPLALNVSATFIPEYAGTNTFTFYGSAYDSSELAFVPDEAFSNQPTTNGACCSTLQNPTAAQQQLIDQNDPFEAYPWLDFSDRSMLGLDWPSVIAGMTWEQIAAALSDPSSAVAQSIDAGAELVAAQLCVMTDEQPASVCNGTVNRQYQQLVAAAPTSVDSSQAGTVSIYGVSCPSTSLCVAVDDAGNVLETHDASAATPTWSAPQNIDGTNLLTSVWCPSTSLCVAVDAAGDALVTHDPAAASPTWSTPQNIDGTNSFYYVSCPSMSLCAASDSAGNVLVTHNPAAATPTWGAPQNIDSTGLSISCPSNSLCVAADSAGNVLVSHNPDATTPTWSAPQNIDGTNTFYDISCASTSLCVAVDSAGNALVTHNPAAATPTWGAPANIDGTNTITAVSCLPSLCVASDAAGNVIASQNPGAPDPTWSAPLNIDGISNADDGDSYLTDVNCPSTSVCVAVDLVGNALVTHNPTAAAPTWSRPAKFLQ